MVSFAAVEASLAQRHSRFYAVSGSRLLAWSDMGALVIRISGYDLRSVILTRTWSPGEYYATREGPRKSLEDL